MPLELVKGIEETETGYREDKRINIKSYSFLPNGVSFHVGHKIVSINNQITPQQKQQAQQLYSSYLNTINPGREIFEMDCIKRDNGDFCDKFIVTRVVINP